jgi:hypothetical protein
MSRWYRAYEGTVTDAKIGEAALVAGCSRSVAIAAWHCILESCASAQNGGQFDTTPRRVAVILGERPADIEAVFAAFTELEMIGSGAVTAWKLRQYESDTSTERSRKHRERQRNGDATLQQREATVPETDTDTEEDKKEGGRDAPALPAIVNRDAELAFDAYNDLASELGLSKAQALTTSRRRKIAARLDECGGLIGWRDAIDKIRGSPFLRGANDRGWRADLDFILQPSSFTRLMEGAYDRTNQRNPAGVGGNTIAGGFDLIDRAIAERERKLTAIEGGQGRGEGDFVEIPRLREGTA